MLLHTITIHNSPLYFFAYSQHGMVAHHPKFDTELFPLPTIYTHHLLLLQIMRTLPPN
jgi:hypothetical protein